MRTALYAVAFSLMAHTAMAQAVPAPDAATAQALQAAKALFQQPSPGPESIHAQGRLIQLEQSSNLRDLGGYRTVDGKHVKWGRLYRSGAPAMLTPADLAALKQRNIVTTIDLRSQEERRLAPSLLANPKERQVVESDYSMAEMFRNLTAAAPQDGRQSGFYHVVLTELAPIFRQSFAALPKENGAVLYHCSAGQDRTGLLTAFILSALGVPRATILADYHLSTPSRRPQYELPPIDLAKHPNDPIAAMFALMQQRQGAKAEPLYDANGVSLLADAFDFIDQKWGSTESYLREVIGLTDADFTRLRAAYLE